MNRVKSLLSSMNPMVTKQKPITFRQTSYQDPGAEYKAMVDQSNAALDQSLASLRRSEAQRIEVETNAIANAMNGEPASVGRDGLNARLTSLADPILNKYGLKITSGYRPNSKLKTSQHRHGSAMDVAWPSSDINVRRAIIKNFQKAGLTGFGVGNNILHVDIGPKRHWTYDGQGNWISGIKKGYTDLFK